MPADTRMRRDTALVTKTSIIGAAVLLLLSTCDSGRGSPATSEVPEPTSPFPPEPVTTGTSSTTLPAPTTTSPPTLPIPDLSDQPLIWFGALPPLPNIVGDENYLELFEQGAAWDTAAEAIDVFVLYAEWVAWNASDAELEQVVADLNRRDIAIAVEGSPLRRPTECDAGVESWGGVPEGQMVAQRIRRAGGRVDLYAMDAPYYYASLLQLDGACRRSAEEVAREISDFIATMEGFFPNIIVGDTEPLLRGGPGPAAYAQWLATYETVTGQVMPFFHLDIDFGRTGWPEETADLERRVQEAGVDFGLFYIGNSIDISDGDWTATAGERIKTYEQVTGGSPDHVLFQSFHDRPDRSIPDSDRTTLSGLVRLYVEQPDLLGVVTSGPGANRAFGGSGSASQVAPGSSVGDALDGDVATWWASGEPPPQWIEVDLGGEFTIATIRMITSQSPAGPTTHRLLVGPDRSSLRLVEVFSGNTADLEELTWSPEESAPGVRFIRVETTVSPSWVSWREIVAIADE